MTAILSNIPVWVFPLFLALLWLGLRSTRDRMMHPVLMFALPLMGIMGVNRALALPQAETASLAFAALYGLAAALGFFVQGRWILGHAGTRVHLRGEWLTLVSVMGLFAVSFAAGMMQGMALDMVQSHGFAALFGCVSGLFSGLFLGRGLRVAMAPIGTAA